MTAATPTNTSAVAALRTLRSTNASPEKVRNQVPTGRNIATAKDSASVVATSKVMEADMAGFEVGFEAVSDSRSLGAGARGQLPEDGK